MSYGTVLRRFRQVGAYTGQVLKGAKPADLPVVQTARALGIEVPNSIQLLADEVIE
jgi:putative ABC transport system substrate-binding protein